MTLIPMTLSDIEGRLRCFKPVIIPYLGCHHNHSVMMYICNSSSK